MAVGTEKGRLRTRRLTVGAQQFAFQGSATRLRFAAARFHDDKEELHFTVSELRVSCLYMREEREQESWLLFIIFQEIMLKEEKYSQRKHGY